MDYVLRSRTLVVLFEIRQEGGRGRKLEKTAY
jgi:hypothetical protein